MSLGIGCGTHTVGGIKREGPPPVGTWQVLGLSGPSGREAHQTPHPAWSTGPPPNQNVRPIYQTNIRHWSTWHQTNIRQTSDTSPCLVNWASLWSTGPPPNQNVRRMRPARRISHTGHWWGLLGCNLNNTLHFRIVTEASWKKRVHSTPSTWPSSTSLKVSYYRQRLLWATAGLRPRIKFDLLGQITQPHTFHHDLVIHI